MGKRLCLQLRVAGAFTPAHSLHTITTQYYTYCGLNCGPQDPCRNCPPPSPPHCREHQSSTNINNSPTHFKLQAALRPCGGVVGWSVNKTQQEPYDTRTLWTLWHRLTLLPYFYFNLLLPPPVHRSLLVQEAVHLLLLDTHLPGRGKFNL